MYVSKRYIYETKTYLTVCSVCPLFRKPVQIRIGIALQQPMLVVRFDARDQVDRLSDFVTNTSSYPICLHPMMERGGIIGLRLLDDELVVDSEYVILLAVLYITKY